MTALLERAPRGDAPSPPAERFRPDIQGLRAIAVGSVVLYHAGIGAVSGGYIGVDVFFVISGFLITSHLLREILATGGLGFGRFYARRARRILPAAFVVIALTLVGAVLFAPPTQLPSTLRDAIATSLYVPNMLFAHRATDYLAQGQAPSFYQHFWSLGVEEQFYLLWPLLLVVAFVLLRRSRARLAVAMGAVALASFAACVMVTGTDEPTAFFWLPTRAWEFALGGLVALALAGPRRLPRPLAISLAALGLVGLVIAIFGYDGQTRFPGTAAALPVVGTALLILGGTQSGPIGRALSVRPMVFVGEISYALYLVHWPVFTLAQAARGADHPLPLITRLGLLALCVPAAYLLGRLVENPVRRSRRLAGLPAWGTLVGALAVSGVVIAFAATTVSVRGRTSLAADRLAAAPTLGLNPAGTSYVPKNVTPALLDVADDNPATYSDGCHLAPGFKDIPSGCTFGANAAAPLVVLWGDSHAAEWFPALAALADAGTIRLESDTKSGCPSADLDVDYKSSTGPQSYPDCPLWRQNVLRHLADVRPALVIMSNYNHPDLPRGGYPSAGQWGSAISRTLARIPSGVHALVVGETPLASTTPADCLSAHLNHTSSCDLKRSAALVPAMLAAERSAAHAGAATYLDVGPYLCNATTCPAIIGNVEVYRDNQHLTATIAASFSPLFARQLKLVLG